MDQLPEFIKAEQKKGVPDETIRIMLFSHGWSSYDIGQAYAYLNGKPAPVYDNKPKKGRALLFVGLLVIAGILWFILY